MIEPNFGYSEVHGRMEISFYYPDETGVHQKDYLTAAKDHIEATDLCMRLNNMLPTMIEASARFAKFMGKKNG